MVWHENTSSSLSSNYQLCSEWTKISLGTSQSKQDKWRIGAAREYIGKNRIELGQHH